MRMPPVLLLGRSPNATVPQGSLWWICAGKLVLLVSPVEDIGLDACAVLEGECHVAAIVEGLLQRPPQVLFFSQRRNPAFKLFVLGSGSQFQRFHLRQRIFQDFGGHARVSSRLCTGSTI